MFYSIKFDAYFSRHGWYPVPGFLLDTAKLGFYDALSAECTLHWLHEVWSHHGQLIQQKVRGRGVYKAKNAESGLGIEPSESLILNIQESTAWFRGFVRMEK